MRDLRERLIDEPPSDWLYIYDNQLDNEFGTVNVAGKKVAASKVMKTLDDTRYLLLFAEWLDSLTDREVQELQAEIEANAD